MKSFLLPQPRPLHCEPSCKQQTKVNEENEENEVNEVNEVKLSDC